MNYKRGRYSNLIAPIFCFIDLIIINITALYFPINTTNAYIFAAYISLVWIIISFKNHYYNVSRISRVIRILTLILRQTFIYAITLYAFIGFFKQPEISRLALGKYFIATFVLLTAFKFLSFYLLNKYRSELSGNIRNVIVIGNNEKARRLINIFKSRLD